MKHEEESFHVSCLHVSPPPSLMSHHFVDLLEELKSRLARMTAMVQQIVDVSVEAMLSADSTLAQRAIDSDVRIDEEEVRVEKSAIDLLALYQPAAVDLRLITMV